MAASEHNKGTILLVDDEPNVLWFISKVCQPRGYATLTAGSGIEALKYIQECGEKLDLVLLDLRMPGMGGLGKSTLAAELARRIVLQGVVDDAFWLELSPATRRVGRVPEPLLEIAIDSLAAQMGLVDRIHEPPAANRIHWAR